MNLDVYKRYLDITDYLADNKIKPFPLFQTFIENKLNDINYTQFLYTENQHKPSCFIRLKKPLKKNSKERGLRLCMIDDSIFTEKSMEAGTTIIQITPLLKVVGFSNNYCCECGKCLVDLENAVIKLTDTKTNDITERNDLKKCLSCNLRVFCSEECKIAANLKWHNLECIFLQYLRKSMITQQHGFDCSEMHDSPYEKSILLLLTSFRLLLLLGDQTEIDVQLIASLTDHFEIYENCIKDESVNIQQNNLYTLAKSFALLIQGFFDAEQKKAKSREVSLGILNEKGLARLFMVVFVNVSTLMNCLNNDIGLMFDPAFSMINHSCNPNCTIVWNDQCKMSIKLTKQLKPGDELLMNYIPIYVPKEMRQVQLRDSFFFQCECEKCRISDKKFDTMLPLQCRHCGQHNRGFLLKNFEINDSLPNMDKKIICTNCESVIEAEVVFTMYLHIMKFFREINPSFEDTEMLAYWNITMENTANIKPALLNRGISLWKDCFEIVSLKSWPMSMLASLVKTQQQIKDPYSLSTLRLTYLSGFLIENMLEKGSVFKTNIGSSIYDLAVSTADFLFDQYLLYCREIDETILSIIGWGVFSLCILSFKHLSVRFDNENKKRELSYEGKIEKAQHDMIQLSSEVLYLFNHLGKITDSVVYNNDIFAKHIANFETYMDCGYKAQLKSLLIPLDKSDYTRFKLTETLSNESTIGVLNPPITYGGELEIPTTETGSSVPPVLLEKPRWINEL